MRRLFKLAVNIHAAVYRLTGGRVGVSIGGMRMLILTTTGRRSGKAHKVPLGYSKACIMDGNCYVVIASYGGWYNRNRNGGSRNPDWYLNLVRKPQALAQVRGHRISVTARTADAAARERLWTQLVTKAPIYQKYQDRTTRQIPLLLLTPCTELTLDRTWEPRDTAYCRPLVHPRGFVWNKNGDGRKECWVMACACG